MKKIIFITMMWSLAACATQTPTTATGPVVSPTAAASTPAATAEPPRRNLSTAWVPLDPAKHCAGVKDPQLCAHLLDLTNKDQIARRKWLADRENKAIHAEVELIDAENMKQLESVIARHGWPGGSLVGQRASGAAWGVVQHAPIATIKKYLPLMTSAMEAGELDGALLATTVDRVEIADGKPQTYGTQFTEVNGEMVPHPIADEAHVDERRAKVGLGPLAEYKEMMKQMYQKKTP